MLKQIFDEDLDFINIHISPMLDDLRQKKILITGATGFIGKWLVCSLLHINKINNLGMKIFVLSRSKDKAEKLFTGVHIIEGDIRYFQTDEQFDFVIHGANTVSNDSLELYETITEGTKHLLNIALQAKVKRLLNISSGAVYAKQPMEVVHLSEDGPLVDVAKEVNPYGVGKCESEKMINDFMKDKENIAVHARCFSFAGAFLPLDGQFAIGNFIKDKLEGKKIELKGDGTPLRSYMYGTDLVIWLITILLRGDKANAYNVGSDQAVSINNLMALIEGRWDGTDFRVGKEASSASQYIPSVDKICKELGVSVNLNLYETIDKFIRWSR